jgi:hypothetical protein
MGNYGISWEKLGVKGKWRRYCSLAMVFAAPVNGLACDVQAIWVDC